MTNTPPCSFGVIEINTPSILRMEQRVSLFNSLRCALTSWKILDNVSSVNCLFTRGEQTVLGNS